MHWMAFMSSMYEILSCYVHLIIAVIRDSMLKFSDSHIWWLAGVN